MHTPGPSSALGTWLTQAWHEHAESADACARIAAELAARAQTLPDDADGAAAVQLAEHVLLAHQADAAALQCFLEKLPPGAALAPNVRRARWALAMLADTPAPALADAARWAALHGVVMALVARGQVARAHALLLGEEAAMRANADPQSRRALAASANNTATDLLATSARNAESDALMIDAAELARRAWAAAGGSWMNDERALYLLALCHAALGHGAAAIAAADACLAGCVAHDADAAEEFFAHECCVRAQRAAGGAAHLAQAGVHQQRMHTLLAQITDAGLLSHCQRTLAAL